MARPGDWSRSSARGAPERTRFRRLHGLERFAIRPTTPPPGTTGPASTDCWYDEPMTELIATGAPAIGTGAVPFSLTDTGGRRHELEDYRRRWLLLVFHRHLA
jgi:hypothetical protein